MTLENQMEEIDVRLARLTSQSSVEDVSALLQQKSAIGYLLALKQEEELEAQRLAEVERTEDERRRESTIREIMLVLKSEHNLSSSLQSKLETKRTTYYLPQSEFCTRLQVEIDALGGELEEVRQQLALLKVEHAELYAVAEQRVIAERKGHTYGASSDVPSVAAVPQFASALMSESEQRLQASAGAADSRRMRFEERLRPLQESIDWARGNYQSTAGSEPHIIKWAEVELRTRERELQLLKDAFADGALSPADADRARAIACAVMFDERVRLRNAHPSTFGVRGKLEASRDVLMNTYSITADELESERKLIAPSAVAA